MREACTLTFKLKSAKRNSNKYKGSETSVRGISQKGQMSDSSPLGLELLTVPTAREGAHRSALHFGKNENGGEKAVTILIYRPYCGYNDVLLDSQLDMYVHGSDNGKQSRT